MRSVEFLPAARLEMIEARDWHARRSAELGEAFITEADRQLARVANTPAEFPIVLADVRRARLRRFPYNLLFREVGGSCVVLACFHASRDPQSWRGRV